MRAAKLIDLTFLQYQNLEYSVASRRLSSTGKLPIPKRPDVASRATIFASVSRAVKSMTRVSIDIGMIPGPTNVDGL